jgi:hypothetical protein
VKQNSETKKGMVGVVVNVDQRPFKGGVIKSKKWECNTLVENVLYAITQNAVLHLSSTIKIQPKKILVLVQRVTL